MQMMVMGIAISGPDDLVVTRTDWTRTAPPWCLELVEGGRVPGTARMTSVWKQATLPRAPQPARRPGQARL